MALALDAQIGKINRSFLLTGEDVTVGTAGGNSLRVSDSLVDAHHCVISLEGRQVFIRDLQSKSGTLVNGEIIREKTSLVSGDVIAIGRAVVKLRETGDGESDLYTKWLSISPKPRPVDHYMLLGLPPYTTDNAQLHQCADRRLETLEQYAMSPDRELRESCQKMMNEVAQAVTALTDPGRRDKYDRTIEGRYSRNSTRRALTASKTASGQPNNSLFAWYENDATTSAEATDNFTDRVVRVDQSELVEAVSRRSRSQVVRRNQKHGSVWLAVGVMLAGFAVAILYATVSHLTSRHNQSSTETASSDTPVQQHLGTQELVQNSPNQVALKPSEPLNSTEPRTDKKLDKEADLGTTESDKHKDVVQSAPDTVALATHQGARRLVGVERLAVDIPISLTGADNRPVTNGRIVVWSNAIQGDHNIYGYDIVNQKTFDICTVKGWQGQPAISGNIVVWPDGRHAPLASIYGLDLETGREFALVKNRGNAIGFPCLNKDDLVYVAMYGGGRIDVELYNMDSMLVKTIASASGSSIFNPVVGGNHVTWTHMSIENDTKLYDMVSEQVTVVGKGSEYVYSIIDDGRMLIKSVIGKESVLNLYKPESKETEEVFRCQTNTGGLVSSVTDGSAVVWTGGNATNGAIYAYDLASKIQVQIASEGEAFPWIQPTISGGIVAWIKTSRENRNDRATHQICLARLKYESVDPAARNKSMQAQPVNAKIVELWREVLANNNEVSGSKALAALNEILTLDPKNIEAKKLHDKISSSLGLDSSLILDLGNRVKLKLVKIKAGDFPKNSDTQLQVSRIENDFYIGESEVTQAQWKAVMSTTPWKGMSNVKEGDDYPAAYVSWDDAQEFLQKLSKAIGRKVRLPTEAEWEYACRAGTASVYFFGDVERDLDQYAWFRESAFDAGERYPHQVKNKKPSTWGLYDMYGNVWEWCEGQDNGKYRAILRGGAWDRGRIECRSANTNLPLTANISPSERRRVVGLRVLMETPEIVGSNAHRINKYDHANTTDNDELINGLLRIQYPRHESQKLEGAKHVDILKLGQLLEVNKVLISAAGDLGVANERNNVFVGAIKVDKAGRYAFKIYGHYTGGARMYIGDTMIDQGLTNNGADSVSIDLKQGYAPIWIYGRIGNRKVTLAWQRPGEINYSAIPGSVLYYRSAVLALIENETRRIKEGGNGPPDDRCAVIKVDGMDSVVFDPLRTKWPESTEGVDEYPKWLENAKVYLKSTGDAPQTLTVRVIKSGTLWLSCHYGYEGNASGDWQRDVTSLDQLKSNGWKEVGHILHKNGRKAVVVQREVRAGEEFKIRANKYSHPVAILVADANGVRQTLPVH